jgi:hypothetical protein
MAPLTHSLGGRSIWDPVHMGPPLVRIEPVVRIELARIEALELLAMTLPHLNVAEARTDMTLRVPLLMGLRDKLALALQEETDT